MIDTNQTAGEIVAEHAEGAIAERAGPGEADPRAMSTPQLLSYIVSRHHRHLVPHLHDEEQRVLPALLAAAMPDGVGRTVERLCAEHGNIARLLLVLEAHLAGLHGGEDVDGRLLLDAVSYLLDYVDQFHHTREDRIVELLSEREPLARAMRTTLSAQHEAIASQGAALRDDLQRAVVDEPVARQDLVRRGFSYAAALRRNMAFEERIVFPLARLALDPADWNAIVDAAGETRADPLFGDAIDGRYRGPFEELARRAGCECSYAPARSPAARA